MIHASASALGRRGYTLNRDEALAHARLITDATDLPVSADLGKGFGDAPEVVAETIRFAAEVGLGGCTIEDATGNRDSPLYDFGLAVERIAAGSEAAQALQFSFILTFARHAFLICPVPKPAKYNLTSCRTARLRNSEPHAKRDQPCDRKPCSRTRHPKQP